MAIPDSLNPFEQDTIYTKYGIDPHASAEEVASQLRGITSELDNLPDDERAERVADLQQAINKIKNHRLRVLMNARIIDTLDNRRVVEMLENLPRPKDEDISLPALGLSQIVMEGECPDYSHEDFTQVPVDSTLELDFEDVQGHLQRRPVERYIVFDD